MRGMFKVLGKQKIRRMLAAALAVCVLAGAVAWPEGAEEVRAENLVEGDFEYQVLEDETVEILKYTGSVEALTIPDRLGGKSVSTIFSAMFIYDNNKLKELIIPSSVNRLGNVYPLFRCSTLKNIYVAEDNAEYSEIDGVLFSKDKTELIRYPEGREGAYTVPSDVKSINMCSFSGCVGLSEIIIPEGVTEIANSVFVGCSRLTSVIISSSVLQIKDDIFSSCKNLAVIEVDSNNAHYSSQDGVLYNKEITELIKCPQAKKEVFIPKTVKRIGGYSFEDCISLTDIYFSGTKEQWENIKIDSYGNSLLDNVTIHYESERNPGEEYDYKELSNGGLELTKYNGSDTEVTVPGEIDGIPIQSIADGVFSGYDSITQITIPDIISEISPAAFKDCPNLTAIEVMSGNEKFCSIDGVLYTKDQMTLIRCPEGKTGAYTILSDVKTIGAASFHGCKNLTDIEIPFGVEKIDHRAFVGCESLIKIDIPASVTDMGINTSFSSQFNKCNKLECINVNSGNLNYASDQGVLHNKDMTRLLKYPEGRKGGYSILSSVNTIESLAFAYCTDLSKIVVPDNVTEIAWGAFGRCEMLNKVSLSSGVKYIRMNTFDKCKKLKEVYIPDSVNGIGEFAFRNCIALTVVKIPDTVNDIGQAAFYDCESLKDIKIPDGIDVIKKSVFACCYKLGSVTIPASVKSIQDYAFYECNDLEDINYLGTRAQWEELRSSGSIGEHNEPLLNAAVHCIDDPAPDDPEADYEYIELEDDTIEITGYKGEDTEIKIPGQIAGRNVSSIGKGAFEDCTKLTKVIIPEGVRRIENEAFASCSSLMEIEIPASVTDIAGVSVFHECTKLKAIHVNADNQNYASDDGVLFNKDMTTLIRFPAAGKTGIYSIPTGVSCIGDYAFGGCIGLTQVIIPDSVNDIDGSAFENCVDLEKAVIPKGVDSIKARTFYQCKSLSEVVIPDSVTSIGTYAFRLCTDLSEIVIPDSVNSIDISAFARCSSLKKVKLSNGLNSINHTAFAHCTALEQIIIPKSLSSIQLLDFLGCTSLASVTLPVGMKSVSTGAFKDCSNLKDVYYQGTEEQWNKIKIMENNDPLLNAVIHFIDGTTLNGPEEEENLNTAKKELQKLKTGDSLSLDKDMLNYLSPQQIDIIESYIYTWLAEINYAYRYQGSSEVKRRLMGRTGLDPEEDFSSGSGRAVTHITVDTKYGPKSIEIVLDIGKPDGSGNLYPAYGRMQYEILEKDGLPASLPKAGQIGKSSYADMAQFIASVEKADIDMLHNTFQWQSLDSNMTAGVLIDKTIISLTGPQNGTFYDGVYTVYEMAVLHYSKKVTVTGRVNVYVKHMDSTQCGAIVNDRVVQSAGADAGKAGIKAYAGADDENVRLEVTDGTKTVYLAKDDYYINLEGTGKGTMNYTVEEMIDEDTKRKVEFLQMTLEKDLKYEGYVFEPLGIDKDLYALKLLDGSNTVVTPDSDDFRSIFRKVTGLSLNQSDTQLNTSRTIQLNASLFPLDASNKNLKWTTDDGSVVTVGQDGLITAAGAGRAVVTVSTLDGSNLKASCVIVVSDGSSPSPGPGNSGGPGGFGGSGGSGGWVSQNPSSPSSPSIPSIPAVQPTSPSAPSIPADIITGPVVSQLYYIISFDVNGGKNLSRRTMTLLKDDPLGILPKAQKDQYLFSGWYTQLSGGEQIKSGMVLDGTATLYARWTKAEKPGKVKALKLKSGKKKQVTVSFKKVKGADGCQVLYSDAGKFPAAGTKKIDVRSRTVTLKKLKKGKTYYVKVRAYTLDSAGNKIYGTYSAVKKVKLKK